MRAQTNEVVIGWNADRNKLEIICPFWANDAIRDIPSKRWDPKRRAWMCAPTRKNIEFIEDHLIKPGFARLLPGVEAVIDKCKQAVDVRTRGTGFPHWYKYKTEPKPHQRKALDKLYGLDCHALHMDRRTGKTKVEIDLHCAMRMEGKIEVWLIICRLSIRRNWVKELLKHAPIPYSVFLPVMDKPREIRDWLGLDHDFKIMIVGLESLSQGEMWRVAEKFLLSSTKGAVTVDESQHISNHATTRTEHCISYGRMTEHRSTMSGTPIRTGPLNLFAQYEFMDPNIFGIGDFYAFRNQYAIMGGYRDPKTKKAMQVVGYRNLEELSKIVAPFTFEVRKEEVLKFPEKQYEIRTVQLTKEQRRIYDEIAKDDAYRIKGMSSEPQIIKSTLESALRLQQVSGGYAVKARISPKGKTVYDPVELVTWKKNPKVVEIMEVIAEEPDAPMIVWASYKPEIAALQQMFKHLGKKYALITGEVAEDQRWEYNRQFQDGTLDYVLGNPAVGGEGLDFYRAQGVIYFNNSNKFVDREQSEDRAITDNLDHAVMYSDIVAEGTVDETILDALQQTLDLSEYVRKRIREAANLLMGVKT